MLEKFESIEQLNTAVVYKRMDENLAIEKHTIKRLLEAMIGIMLRSDNPKSSFDNGVLAILRELKDIKEEPLATVSRSLNSAVSKEKIYQSILAANSYTKINDIPSFIEYLDDKLTLSRKDLTKIMVNMNNLYDLEARSGSLAEFEEIYNSIIDTIKETAPNSKAKNIFLSSFEQDYLRNTLLQNVLEQNIESLKDENKLLSKKRRDFTEDKQHIKQLENEVKNSPKNIFFSTSQLENEKNELRKNLKADYLLAIEIGKNEIRLLDLETIKLKSQAYTDDNPEIVNLKIKREEKLLELNTNNLRYKESEINDLENKGKQITSKINNFNFDSLSKLIQHGETILKRQQMPIRNIEDALSRVNSLNQIAAILKNQTKKPPSRLMFALDYLIKQPSVKNYKHQMAQLRALTTTLNGINSNPQFLRAKELLAENKNLARQVPLKKQHISSVEEKINLSQAKIRELKSTLSSDESQPVASVDEYKSPRFNANG